MFTAVLVTERFERQDICLPGGTCRDCLLHPYRQTKLESAEQARLRTSFMGVRKPQHVPSIWTLQKELKKEQVGTHLHLIRYGLPLRPHHGAISAARSGGRRAQLVTMGKERSTTKCDDQVPV